MEDDRFRPRVEKQFRSVVLLEGVPSGTDGFLPVDGLEGVVFTVWSTVRDSAFAPKPEPRPQ